VLVSLASLASLQDQDFLPVADKIRDFFPCPFIVDQGAGRDLDDNVLPVLAGLVPAPSGFAVSRFEKSSVFEIEESGQSFGGPEEDASSLAAVPSVRSASGDEFLASEADAALSSVPRTDGDQNLVNETHRLARMREECG
jgi:hypothetical protein